MRREALPEAPDHGGVVEEVARGAVESRDRFFRERSLAAGEPEREDEAPEREQERRRPQPFPQSAHALAGKMALQQQRGDHVAGNMWCSFEGRDDVRPDGAAKGRSQIVGCCGEREEIAPHGLDHPSATGIRRAAGRKMAEKGAQDRCHQLRKTLLAVGEEGCHRGKVGSVEGGAHVAGDGEQPLPFPFPVEFFQRFQEDEREGHTRRPGNPRSRQDLDECRTDGDALMRRQDIGLGG